MPYQSTRSERIEFSIASASRLEAPEFNAARYARGCGHRGTACRPDAARPLRPGTGVGAIRSEIRELSFSRDNRRGFFLNLVMGTYVSTELRELLERCSMASDSGT